MNLNQVTIPSLDVEASIAFYEKLGLQLIVKALPHYARFLLPEGDATLSLHFVEDITPNEWNAIYFENEKLEEEVEKLINKGITFEHLPKDQPWLWKEARLKDPAGNVVILFHAGKNRKNPPWRIN